MNTLVVMTHLQKDSVTRIILWQNSASYQVYLKNVESQDKVVKEIEKMDGVRQVSQSQSAAKTLSTSIN